LESSVDFELPDEWLDERDEPDELRFVDPVDEEPLLEPVEPPGLAYLDMPPELPEADELPALEYLEVPPEVPEPVIELPLLEYREVPPDVAVPVDELPL
jgi:hypothetical protein